MEKKHHCKQESENIQPWLTMFFFG